MDSVLEDTSELCSFCGRQFAIRSLLNKHKLLCQMNSDNTQAVQRICAHCGKIFAHKSSLHRHERICREGTSEHKFKCPVCYSEFSRVDNYRRHYRDCNPDVPKPTTNATCKLCHKLFSNAEDLDGHTCITKKKHLLSTCLYEDCKMTFYRRSQLTRHLRTAHGNRIEEEKNMVFESMNDFLEWKLCEEQATFSCFTKRSGTRANTDYYYCQLDGSSKPHCKTGYAARKTSRRVKRGTVKKDKICLAKMKVKIESDGTCKVVYQPTHSHRLNIKDHQPHILLTDTVKYVNEQLLMGVSPKKCFKTIINGTLNNAENETQESKPSRPVLVSGINTLALFKRVKIKFDKDDAVSVMIRVALLSKEQPNPVILYKPLGEDKVIGPNKVDRLINSLDLFILGIQTKEQKSMMVQCSRVILSINWVDDTNAYGYRLLTIAVPDDHNRGYPVAYFILNQFNESTLSGCMLAIKENCADLVVSSVIIPDNSLIMDALENTFGKDVIYILCLSNIQKIFLHYLEDMAPREVVCDMYQLLCSIMDCNDESAVTNGLDEFIEIYSEKAPTFLQFLKEHYLYRVEQWTMAHRKFPHGNVDTTVINESIHNTIKAADMNDADTRRLDELLNILLDLEEDNYKKKYMEEHIGIPYGLGDVLIGHADGLKISDDCIMHLNTNVWGIVSETNSEMMYQVVKCADNCFSDICYFTCNSYDCNNLCSHLYSCSCEDKNPLCSHIHKLQTFLHRDLLQNKTLSESNEEPEVSEIGQAEITDKKLDKIKTHLQQLSLFIQNEQVEPVVLNRIESCLQQLLTECQVYDSASVSTGSLSQTIKDEERPCSSSDIASTEVLQDCITKDDMARYEFEYVHQDSDLPEERSANLKESVDLTESTASFDLPVADIVSKSFTPSLNYASLNQIVIKTGTEELPLLYLKSLDPFLTNDELKDIKRYHRYRERYMYPALINSFLFHLQLSYTQIVSINSDIALTLERNKNAKTLFTKEMLEKEVLIMPMNLSDNYWTCIAIFNKEKEIIYFNPFGKMTKKDEKTVRNFLNSIAEYIEWSITIPNYSVEIEDDGMAYGVHVCHFAEEIAKQIDLTPLKDTNAYRKHIYESIVGGCLKRDMYDNTLCGKCNNDNCPYVQEGVADFSVCCDKCNQWYHNLCVGNTTTDFTCQK